MLNADNGNPYLVSDLSGSLLGIFAVVSGRNPSSKDISSFFPLFVPLVNPFKNDSLDLNNPKYKLDLTGIYRTFHPATAEYICSQAHVEHSLG